jgi:hypothetical protein
VQKPASRRRRTSKTRDKLGELVGYLGALIHGAGSDWEQAGVWERLHHTLLD